MIQSVPESDPGEALADVARLQAGLAHMLERETLLRGEVQHRVRNMLAIVRSVFARTVAASNSVEEVSDHFRGRLDAIGRYESLRGADPSDTIDLEYILREELKDFSFGDESCIAIAGPEVTLSHGAAQAMGLALHELATNSIKFGVLGTPQGRARLEIDWTLSGGALAFHWRETGVAVLASAPLRRGFGREFIEDGLPYQLGATTRFELRPGGIACTITLPPGAAGTPRTPNDND